MKNKEIFTVTGNHSSTEEGSSDVQVLGRGVKFPAHCFKVIVIVLILIVLGGIKTIVLTTFVGREVKRRPHIILILADDLGKSPIHKCKGNRINQNISIYRIQ